MLIKRRQRILEVSRELFLHYGYQKVTLVDIAEALGVSRPTVYQIFSNKEEIFKALLEDWWRSAISRIIDSRDPKVSTKKQLLDAIEIWVIEPYLMMSESPKGEQLADCSYGFAKHTLDAGYVEFSKQIGIILKDTNVESPLPHNDLSHFIAISLRGLKAQANNLTDLRKLVDSLLKLTLN